MPDEQITRIVVTVDDQHLSDIQSVSTALQSAGMKVENVLPSTGIITGEVAQPKIQELKNLPGVVDVEPDQEMRAI